MPWFRLDDNFDTHPKVIAAGNEAIGLYIRCGTHAARHLTDGFVSKDVVLSYGSTALADTLVRVRLWHRARGGWTIHDYLDYNPSREAVENERKLKAERQKRWLEARKRRVSNASADASKDATPAPPRPAGDSGAGSAAPGRAASRRAGQAGGANARPPWCGTCDKDTRQAGSPDHPVRCPRCHPLARKEPAW